MESDNLKLPQPIQTVPYDCFAAVVDEMKEIRKRLEVLESQLFTNSEWLTRGQAMKFLQVGSTKLWGLAKKGAIETNKKIGKPLFLTSSCRDYLANESFSEEHIQSRFQEILRTRT